MTISLVFAHAWLHARLLRNLARDSNWPLYRFRTNRTPHTRQYFSGSGFGGTSIVQF